jgi:hypothetical protein
MSPAKLQEALRDLHADAMIRQAQIIHDWPAGPERDEHAATHVRFALWEQNMGRITDETKQAIFSTLCFALPAVTDFTDGSTPLETLEREADWELAYHDQLDRQQCPECGDGEHFEQSLDELKQIEKQKPTSPK